MYDNSDDESLNGSKFIEVHGNYNESDEDTKMLSPIDYLLAVKHEAKLLPDIIEKKTELVQPRKLGISLQIASRFIENNKSEKFSSEFNPSVTKFEELRQIVEKFKTTNPSQKIKYRFPDLDDEKGWILCCLGSNTRDSDQSGTNLEPLLSVICSLSQAQIAKVLGYLSQCDNAFSHLWGRWVFGLLSALSVPFDNEIAFNLRSIARRLIRWMKQEKTPTDVTNRDEAMAVAADVIFLVICHTFQQKDLLGEK